MTLDLSPHEKSLVEAAWKALQGGDFPAEIESGSLELEAAYRIGMSILERQPDAVLAGPLFSDGLRETGCDIPASLPGLVLEVEVGLTLDLPLSGPNVTSSQARAAVASLDPCFEVIGGHLPKVDLKKIKGLLALGMGNWGVVSAVGLSPVPKAFDPKTLGAELLIDGKAIAAAPASADGPDPFEILAGLANHLARFGLGLEAGQRVITGARVVQMECPAGRYEGRVSGLGRVSMTLC
jgi:2-keto-4-pentenoate hydratase